MLYKILIDKSGEESNIVSSGYGYWGRQSYKAIFSSFKETYTTNIFTFIEGIKIYVGKGYLLIEKDSFLNVIVLVENNTLIIDKSFERDYPLLYRKFKPIIQEYSNNKFDIMYTDFCGRTRFLEFEKPKFSTIKERDEFVNSLLDEIYEKSTSQASH